MSDILFCAHIIQQSYHLMMVKPQQIWQGLSKTHMLVVRMPKWSKTPDWSSTSQNWCTERFVPSAMFRAVVLVKHLDHEASDSINGLIHWCSHNMTTPLGDGRDWDRRSRSLGACLCWEHLAPVLVYLPICTPFYHMLLLWSSALSHMGQEAMGPSDHKLN